MKTKRKRILIHHTSQGSNGRLRTKGILGRQGMTESSISTRDKQAVFFFTFFLEESSLKQNQV